MEINNLTANEITITSLEYLQTAPNISGNIYSCKLNIDFWVIWIAIIRYAKNEQCKNVQCAVWDAQTRNESTDWKIY